MSVVLSNRSQEAKAILFYRIITWRIRVTLNHHSVITSQVPVCYPVDILSESGYNLTVLRFSKIKLLFAVSVLTKVILIKVYRVRCITVWPLSSHPADN